MSPVTGEGPKVPADLGGELPERPDLSFPASDVPKQLKETPAPPSPATASKEAAAKPETKPEVKSEEKPVLKPEAKPEAAEAKPAAAPEAKPVAEPERKPEAAGTSAAPK
jgi:hypothetical protein